MQNDAKVVAEAINKNTAALLTVAATLAKAGGVSQESVSKWIMDDTERIYKVLLKQVNSLF